MQNQKFISTVASNSHKLHFILHFKMISRIQTYQCLYLGMELVATVEGGHVLLLLEATQADGARVLIIVILKIHILLSPHWMREHSKLITFAFIQSSHQNQHECTIDINMTF